MTIVLLTSVSLFALVVASRPILPESDLSDFAPISSTLQTTVQTPFRIHPGKDDLKLDATRFQSQTPECLSELDADTVAAVASFEISDGVKPLFEALLEDPADSQNVLDANNELDDSRAGHVGQSITPEAAVDEQQDTPTDESPAAPLVVLAFSCVAAFLALACIALTLYIIKSLRSQMLASKRAWELLPRSWKRPRSSAPQENTSATTNEYPSSGGCLLLQTEDGEQRLLDAEEGSVEKHDLRTEDRPLHLDAISDMESEWDDVDEKYQDALDMTPLPLTRDLPLEERVSHQSHFDDPPLPSGSCPLDQLTGDRSTLMRDLCPSPVSRPAWSLRAIDSPALGLPSCLGDGVDATPQSLIHTSRRAYRSAVPEFDVALAMQLRPGLGLGADSAWMVRFLMAMFGWFAVALTGNAR